MAIMPGKSLEFQSTVLETDGEHLVVDSALTLIKKILIHHYSCYESRKDAVKLDTCYRKKLPIPIFFDALYMFPTHAVDHHDCCWVAEEYVQMVKKGHTSKDCFIVFKNGEELHVTVSASIVRRQRKRAQDIQRIIKEKGIV